MILAQKFVRLAARVPFGHRLAAAVIAIPCFSVVAAFGIAPDTIVEKVAVTKVVEEIQLPAYANAVDTSATFVREDRVQRGDTVANLMARLQIDDPEAMRVLRNSKQARTLYQLIPGKTVRATADANNKLVSLRYLNGNNLLVLDRVESGYTLKEEPAALERRVMMKSAEIRHSLFGATDAAGLPDSIATQLADIFSTDIDFHRDLRRGDRFSVVYEVFYDRAEPVKTGRVLAAEFINQGKSYQAVYFNYNETQGAYYSIDGKSLRKQFLRSPLEFSRITSGFTMRFHPILQTWRAHKGIDYAAPTGTRIRATGDGVVDIAAKHSGYGNVVVLRHQNSYTTWYGHLSGFANGIQKGKRVSQGDVIGYVGSTGLATGPHLHYEFRINDVHQNPLLAALPDAPPITGEQLEKFELTAKPYAQRLGLLRNTNLARLD
jgi:murein DD-endopeptidase MepM/ murein hydrolase activator NlpD